MTKSLKTLAKQALPTHLSLTVTERLPSFIQAPCEVVCDFSVDKKPGYYQLSLKVQAMVTVICQRCLSSFDYPYQHQSDIAICPNDETAERLMTSLESVVNPSDDIDLLEIVTDELHLFCPEKHDDATKCDTFLPLQVDIE